MVLGAPLTFNMINKWAMGVSDTLALGVLNELLGVGIPIFSAPCAKDALRKHPAYGANVRTLTASGVHFLNSERLTSRLGNGLVTFDWPAVVGVLDAALYPGL